MRIFILIATFLVVLVSCSENKTSYQASNYYAQERIDSLMLDVVYMMGRKPKNVNKDSVRLEKYNDFYLQQANEYKLAYLHVDSDSVHFFYIIRPARNHNGNVNRAAGGRFMIDTAGKIDGFEEVFNTTIMPVDTLIEVGLPLFEAMIAGKTESFIHDKKFVEWPNAQSVYDTNINEWVYPQPASEVQE
jgi:hypothetical protein